MFGRTLALVAIVAAFGISFAARPTPHPDSTDRRILFVSTRDGLEDIYSMNPDGSDVQRLTETTGEDRGSRVPAWSPDGTRVVFASNRDDGGATNLYVMAADGSNLSRLTDHDGWDYVPDWSPDGNKIAFMSNRDGPPEIYLMDADGSNVERLTFLEKGSNLLCCPDWSPDGTMIAFHAVGEGAGFQIHVMDADGGNMRVLGRGALPRWSPDGSRIAFVDQFQTHVMNADGSERIKLTAVEGRAMYPVWSPDGSKISFSFMPRGGGIDGCEIYVMDADGSNAAGITSNQAFDGHAYWW